MKKGLITSVIFGFLLLIGIVCLIWWNETVGFKSKRLIKTITTGAVEVDSNVIDAKNDGKLVVVNGDLKYTEGANDYQFDIYIKTPRIRRVVEVFQYKEVVDENDGEKTYKYETVWDSSFINSNTFNDKTKKNTFDPEYKTQDFYAEDLSIGKYKFSDSLKEQISLNSVYKDLDPIVAEAYDLKINDIYYTNSEDVNNPKVGDIRISFVYSDEKEGTILAMQSFDSFITFTTNKGIVYNKFVPRITTKKAMVTLVANDNDVLRWQLRFSLAFILFLLAFISFRPITRLSENLFFFGRISVSYLALLCAFLSLIVCFIEAGLVWIIYNPIITFVLFALVLLFAFLIYFTGKRNYALTVPVEERGFEPVVLESIDRSISSAFNENLEKTTQNNE